MPEEVRRRPGETALPGAARHERGEPAAELAAAFDPPPLRGVVVLEQRARSSRAAADRQALVAAGAAVHRVSDLDRALSRTAPGQPVVVVLDEAAPAVGPRQLPDLTHRLGEGFCVVVGDLGSAARARLLLGGADDSLPSPYVPEELVARVLALVRMRWAAPAGRPVGTGLDVDVARRTVHLGDAPVALTQREFDLLAHFLAHPDVVLSREHLLSQVWGYDFGSTATVTVHVRRLRGKIEVDPGQPQRLLTVRGVGYLYVGEPPRRSLATRQLLESFRDRKEQGLPGPDAPA